MLYAGCPWNPLDCMPKIEKEIEIDPSQGDEEERRAESFYTVFFKNHCYRRIETAIRYKNVNGEWTTDGWWVLDEGETRAVANSKNTVFYSYAHTTKNDVNRKLYWSGKKNDDEARSYSINNSSHKYRFRKKNTGSTRDDFVLPFYCDN